MAIRNFHELLTELPVAPQSRGDPCPWWAFPTLALKQAAQTYAHFASPNGSSSHPGLHVVARACGVGKKQAGRITRDLIERGWIAEQGAARFDRDIQRWTIDPQRKAIGKGWVRLMAFNVELVDRAVTSARAARDIPDPAPPLPLFAEPPKGDIQMSPFADEKGTSGCPSSSLNEIQKGTLETPKGDISTPKRGHLDVPLLVDKNKNPAPACAYTREGEPSTAVEPKPKASPKPERDPPAPSGGNAGDRAGAGEAGGDLVNRWMAFASGRLRPDEVHHWAEPVGTLNGSGVVVASRLHVQRLEDRIGPRTLSQAGFKVLDAQELVREGIRFDRLTPPPDPGGRARALGRGA